MIHAAVVQYLRNNLSNSRIFGMQAPQNTVVPYVIVDLEHSSRDRTHAAAGANTALITNEFEVSIFADSIPDAVTLGDEIRILLENKRVLMSDGFSPETVHRIADIRIDSELSGFDAGMERWSHSIFVSITATE